MKREELAKAVTLALVENGVGQGSSVHGWRCDYPDLYGACDCLAETVTDVVDAVLAIGAS